MNKQLNSWIEKQIYNIKCKSVSLLHEKEKQILQSYDKYTKDTSELETLLCLLDDYTCELRNIVNSYKSEEIIPAIIKTHDLMRECTLSQDELKKTLEQHTSN